MNAMSDEQVVHHVLRYKTDYYRLLMIERTATNDQIKLAYKKMALKCHPDKNKLPQAVEAFKFVGLANTTLSDTNKRRIYDRQGAEGVQRHESGGGVRRQQTGDAQFRARGARQQQQQRDFFEDLFFGNGGFFGDAGGGGGGRGRQGGGAAANDAGPRVNINGVDVSASVLMLIPLFFFLVIAMLLQNSMMDTSGGSSYGNQEWPSSSRARSAAATAFSLTPVPEQGFVVHRQTSLYGIQANYYTTRRWADMMEKRRDALLATEKEVVKSHQEYLGKRCEAEMLKYRARGRKDAPDVCAEYHRTRRAMG